MRLWGKRERKRPRFASVYVVIHSDDEFALAGVATVVDSLYWDRDDAESRRAQLGDGWLVVQWDVD